MIRSPLTAELFVSDVCDADVDAAVHARRVASLCHTMHSSIVGYLHDLVEDYPHVAETLRQELIAGGHEHLFASILLLTRTKEQTYADYIEAIAASGDVVAIEVKIADLCDHLCYGCPTSLVPRYLKALDVLHRQCARQNVLDVEQKR